MADDVSPELLIENAQSFANSLVSQARTALNEAKEAAKGIAIPTTGDIALRVDPPEVDAVGEVPEFRGVLFEDPGIEQFYTPPTLREVPDLQLPTEPGLPPEPPAFVMPAAPTETAPDMSILGDLPEIDDLPTAPEAPDLLARIEAITVPTLETIRIGDVPELQEPGFDGVRPADFGDRPSDLLGTGEGAYERILDARPDFQIAKAQEWYGLLFPGLQDKITSVETRLASYAQSAASGTGTGLQSVVEDKILARTQDRTNTEFTRAREQARSAAARAGQTTIGPSVAGILRDVDLERRNANNRAAIDIAIDQAKREQDNLKWAFEQMLTLRRMAGEFLGQYLGNLTQLNGQAIQFAGIIVDESVKVFEIAARKAELQARIYEADARIYEARLRGALAVLEAFQAKVKAEEAKASVNVALVNQYKAQIEAVQAEAQVYRAEIDALTSLAQVQRLKVEVYQAKVGGLAAQSNAYVAHWQGFTAAVGGERAKQEAAAERLRGYQAQVGAWATSIDGKAKSLVALQAVNEGKVKVATQQVSAYEAVVRAGAQVASSNLGAYDSTIRAFIGRAQATAERERARIAAFQAANEMVNHQANIQLQKLERADHVQATKIQALAQIAGQIAQVHGQVASSFGSGINSLAAKVATTSE